MPAELPALVFTLDAVLAVITWSALVAVSLLSIRERIRDFGVLESHRTHAEPGDIEPGQCPFSHRGRFVADLDSGRLGPVPGDLLAGKWLLRHEACLRAVVVAGCGPDHNPVRDGRRLEPSRAPGRPNSPADAVRYE